MTSELNIGLIGLGVMGQRMLARLQAHPSLRPTWVWDADPAALRRTLQAHPGVQVAADAQALIRSPGLQGLYIATPPAAHLALSEAAFDAGLGVLCEKPLTVDFDAAERCVARIAREGRCAAVNFSLASSPGLALLQQCVGSGPAQPLVALQPLGALQAVQIELAFAAWPRPWQAGAGAWLGQRAEGGFVREVLSHFIFAMQRVAGPATLLRSAVVYPDDGSAAETSLQAELRLGEVPVHIRGRVHADVAVPDHNHMHWQAERGAIELDGWFRQVRLQQGGDGQGGDWQALDLAPWTAAGTEDPQLDQWVAALSGQPHGLPGYAEALAVQRTVEALLAGR